MGVDTALGSILAAFGLSGAAGLNPWLPLFGSALLARLDLVDLAAPFDELATTPGLIVLALLTIADFVGDKIPVVDHVLHAAGAAVAPASGAILFAGQSGAETGLPTLAAVVLGALTAGSVHAGRAAVRPVATASTAGLGNPVVSLVEDVASAALAVAAFVVPAVAVLLLVLLLGALLWVRRRFRRR
ncbi:MAG TPA: DUF4126 domain-containing protein [Gaiellaceae bacterium]|nr:DUF4126 domain-containing protein [Gaiellaceae bacterium]